jgi:putative phosphoesterase
MQVLPLEAWATNSVSSMPGCTRDPSTLADVRVLVVSDTHIPDFAKSLPPVVLAEASRADLILHAGDVTSPQVLDELAKSAPVLCALGNGDGTDVAAWGARSRIEVRLDDVAVAMVHDAGPRKGRARRLRRWFPEADLVVFGHSHIPMDISEEGIRLLNPGSPTWKRRQEEPTFSVMTVNGGGIRTRTVPVR